MFTANTNPGDGLGIFTSRDQQSIFFGFEFGKSVFFLWGVLLVIAAVFLGLSNKCCFLSVLHFEHFYNSVFWPGLVSFTKCLSKHNFSSLPNRT